MGVDVLNLGLNEVGNANFSADLDTLAADLRIALPLVAYIVQLCLKITAVGGIIIRKYIQRALTAVESNVAQICLILDVLLADLVLETTALEVFVCAFVDFHFALPFFCLSVL